MLINDIACPKNTGPAYGNLTLIDSGPIVAVRIGNEHYMGMLFEVWTWPCLVPRYMLTQTASGVKN